MSIAKKIVILTGAVVIILVIAVAIVVIFQNRQMSKFYDNKKVAIEQAIAEADRLIAETEETLKNSEEMKARIESLTEADTLKIYLSDLFELLQKNKSIEVSGLDLENKEVTVYFNSPDPYSAKKLTDSAYLLFIGIADKLRASSRAGEVDTISLISRFNNGKTVKTTTSLDNIADRSDKKITTEEFLKKVKISPLKDKR